ncbi:hypothetical protein IFM89_022436 [Coptis chinensis]|uniref:Pentatricopeptide repeat-containing protein n=1 Tax=Coptis chinensis TaxID=261450 RepID=A0A835I5F8_9MAGN|nr:hypothetical protein IFM89_022436 [Coptis chinensis]
MDFAQNLFEKCIPNSHTYNVLIDEKKMDKALLLLDKMVEVGVEPTVFTYTILIDGKLEQAEDFMIKMNKEGIRPDLVTYIHCIVRWSVWLSSSLDWVERHHLLNYLPVDGNGYGAKILLVQATTRITFSIL